MNRAWIELDKNALKENIEKIQSRLAPGCRIMAVMKAEAYGHGAVQTANFLEKNGVRDFCTATFDEAMQLRLSGVEGQILVLGYTDPGKAGEMADYGITQAVTCLEYAKQLDDAVAILAENGKKVPVHIAVDSGMHRIGILYNEVGEMEEVYKLPNLKVTGIFSHLCAADSDSEKDRDFTKMQIERYFGAIDALRARGIDVKGTHLQNSYACVNYTPQPCDYARLGILMFGARSSETDWLDSDPGIRPVLSLRTKVTSVRSIGEGESVGYGCAFMADRPMRIASIGIGYADGIPRALGNGKMRVILHGQYAQGIGRICMDQMMIDISSIPDVRVGDTVTLIGTDGACGIRVEELAENAGTITNEILSRLGSRLERAGI